MESLENFLIDFDEIEEIEEIDLPSGATGFGCTCSNLPPVPVIVKM